MRTIGSQFASEIKASKETFSLVELNQAIRAYIDTTYHRTIYSETRQSPHDRYYNENRIVRAVAIESVQSYFLERELRRIDSTHSHASLAGVARSLAGH